MDTGPSILPVKESGGRFRYDNYTHNKKTPIHSRGR